MQIVGPILYVGGDFTRCTSPKTYKKLAPGGHVFRVRARDRAGNLDATPAVTRFKIKKQ